MTPISLYEKCIIFVCVTIGYYKLLKEEQKKHAGQLKELHLKEIEIETQCRIKERMDLVCRNNRKEELQLKRKIYKSINLCLKNGKYYNYIPRIPQCSCGSMKKYNCDGVGHLATQEEIKQYEEKLKFESSIEKELSLLED